MSELDILINKLRKTRQELLEHLEQVEKAIKEVESLRDRYRPVLTATPIVSLQEKPPSESPNEGDIQKSSPREVVIAVRDVLLDIGKPMRRGDLARELEKRGFIIPGADKTKNLGTIIWRNPQTFIALHNLGYWLKDKSIPGVYDPNE